MGMPILPNPIQPIFVVFILQFLLINKCGKEKAEIVNQPGKNDVGQTK